MDATGLPGGYVEQREKYVPHKGDCFSACVSMLTGIDLDLLPLHPPQFEYWKAQEWYHFNLIAARWHDWQELLADNGFKMEFVDDATTYIAACWTPGMEAHSVVVHEGIVYNPALDERIAVEELGWAVPFKVTVTPL